MGFGDKPTTAKIGAVLLLVAFLLALVGSASPSWLKSGTSTQGIWMVCLGPGVFENCVSISLTGQPDHYYATIALIVLGVIMVFVAMCAALCGNSRAVAIILGIIGGLALVIAVVVYFIMNKESNPNLGEQVYWGLYLTGISGGMAFIGALLLIPNQNHVGHM